MDKKSEFLWPSGPEYICREGVFPLSTDSVLLSDFAAIPRRGTVADLGCGSGILLLLALWGQEGIKGYGLDMDPAAIENTACNLRQNGLSDRAELFCGDIRNIPALLPPRSCDLVLANPPYFPAGSMGESAARKETDISLAELCAGAGWILRDGGRFCAVYRPERMAELMAAMEGARLTPKRLRFVQDRVEKSPSLLLIEGRKQAKPGLRVEPVLLLREADGSESREYRRIYKREGTK